MSLTSRKKKLELKGLKFSRYKTDKCGVKRPRGKQGRRRRKKVERRGTLVSVKLCDHGPGGGCWVNLYPQKKKYQEMNGGRFVHLSEIADVQRCYAEDSAYHISVRRSDHRIWSDPQAMAHRQTVIQWFGGHRWYCKIPVAGINPETSVAWLPPAGGPFGPILGSLQYLRRWYSCHTSSQDLSISM